MRQGFPFTSSFIPSILFHMRWFLLSLYFLQGTCIEDGICSSTQDSTCSGFDVRVMTYNIRYDPYDPIESLFKSFPPRLDDPMDAHPWPERAPGIASFVLKKNPDIIGVQEARLDQDNVLSLLTRYRRVATTRRNEPNVTHQTFLLSFVGAAYSLSIIFRSQMSAQSLQYPLHLVIIHCLLLSFGIILQQWRLTAGTGVDLILLSPIIILGLVLMSVVSCAAILSRDATWYKPWHIPIVMMTAYFISYYVVAPYMFGDEGSPIFFNPATIAVIDHNVHWLNPEREPGKIAHEWGAGCIRIATRAKFMHLATQTEFTVINTHLDHLTQNAQDNGAAIVAELAAEAANIGPVFALGDFNTYIATGAWYNMNNTLADSYFSTANPHTGPLKSFQNFATEYQCGRACDWIFHSRNDIEVHNRYSEFSRHSDHLPVWIDASFHASKSDTFKTKEDFSRIFSDCKMHSNTRY